MKKNPLLKLSKSELRELWKQNFTFRDAKGNTMVFRAGSVGAAKKMAAKHFGTPNVFHVY